MSDKVKPKQGGKGRNGFPYNEAETRTIVKEMLAEDSGAAKKSLAEYYNTSVATLNKKAVDLGLKDAPTPRASKKRAARTSRQETSVFDQIEALAGNVDTALADLDEEEKELQEQLAGIEKKRSMLKKIAEISNG